MTTATKNLTEIPASAVARIVRKEIVKAFPGVKFSVSGRRSPWYIEEGELNITWIDGPTTEKVEKWAQRYKGIDMHFDSYAEYWDSEHIANDNGTYYAVGSINLSRRFSDGVRSVTAAKLMALSGAANQQDLEDNFHNFNLNAVLKTLINPDYRPDINNYEDAFRFVLHHDDHPVAPSVAASASSANPKE